MCGLATGYLVEAVVSRSSMLFQSTVPMALRLVGTSKICGMTPIGLPSGSVWFMNATSALVRPSMVSAVSAPLI